MRKPLSYFLWLQQLLIANQTLWGIYDLAVFLVPLTTVSPTKKYALQFNIQNNISTFVPKQLRCPPSELSYNQQQLQENIEVFDLLFRAMIEDFKSMRFETDFK
jgi:hypothetical protein